MKVSLPICNKTILTCKKVLVTLLTSVGQVHNGWYDIPPYSDGRLWDQLCHDLLRHCYR